MRWLIVVLAFVLPMLAACDRQVPQTVIVRAAIPNPSLTSVWLVEADQCANEPIAPGWYRNGLWIFKLESTRGGVGAVTQELALCYRGADGSPVKAWHSLHGGGAPLLVLSCDENVQQPCALFMDQHTDGAWEEPAKKQ